MLLALVFAVAADDAVMLTADDALRGFGNCAVLPVVVPVTVRLTDLTVEAAVTGTVSRTWSLCWAGSKRCRAFKTSLVIAAFWASLRWSAS